MSYHVSGKQVHDASGSVLVLGKNKVIRAAAPGSIKDSDRVLTPDQFVAEVEQRGLKVQVEGYAPPAPKKAKEEKSESK